VSHPPDPSCLLCWDLEDEKLVCLESKRQEGRKEEEPKEVKQTTNEKKKLVIRH
jgi:hypothetical protein